MAGSATAERDVITEDQPFSVRYHWTEGDIGFWDNRSTQHAVVGDFGAHHRAIQRVTLRGDEPRGLVPQKTDRNTNAAESLTVVVNTPIDVETSHAR